MFKTIKQIREQSDQLRENLWHDRFDPKTGVKPAVKFRGKVYNDVGNYRAQTHTGILSQMQNTLKITRQQLDDELDADSFGYTLKDGTFTTGEDDSEKSDMGKRYKRKLKESITSSLWKSAKGYWDDPYRKRWRKGSDTYAAVKFKGKVYTNKDQSDGDTYFNTHTDVMQKMIKDKVATAEELDKHLKSHHFGYSVNGKWTPGKTDRGSRTA